MPGAVTNPQQLVVAARTFVYLAPVGTAFPVNVDTAPAAAWISVGLTEEDGLKFSTEPDFQEITSAQSDFPVRRIQTKDAASIEVTLQEWSGTNFQAVFGGGTITKTGTAGSEIYKFTPPQIGERIERACMLETHDGDKIYRFAYPRVFQIEGVELEFKKTNASTLPLKLGILGGDGTAPWYAITNDPSFDTA